MTEIRPTSLFRVPNPNSAVTAADGNERAVLGHRDGMHRPAMRVKHALGRAGLDVQPSSRSVFAAGQQMLAGWAKRERPHIFLMSVKDLHLLGRVGVPDTDRVIPTG